ncbi:PLP-dependent aspartate aminotransferase family protein [Tissierella sp. MB52-C2]|uniref:trans-sulfuration enzyme family protein n=1 Tax=Tissierella sp. MB52-C2 TaxID=3070999 RepID=UPI00280C1C0B|nr:PLP-dependent aspartate aminotransferase family protein [Tissierella sp. MB52-C2]WMM23289.1 PLP-dependent aspartate aminotransferase family protein [Tissierella sp. MB52-C2]
MRFDTRTIHGGIKGKNPSNALNPPIFQTSTFVFDNIEHANKIMSFESDDYVYTRGNNPTIRLFENRMAELEHGVGAVAFSSGMAAISSTIFSLLKPKDTIIVHKTLYGSSYSVVTELLPKYNINYKIVDLTDLNELENTIDESTKVIYFETPSNPDLSIIDIRKVREIGKKNNIKIVVDNTFASPYFQNPLLLGADIVVHSATKYICGHGDVVAGVAISKDIEYINYLKFGYMCEFGGAMSPFNAWLLLRGLKTLGIRMRQHEKNAKEVVDFLKNHPKIDSVLYPGLEDFKGHNIAKEQMKGFGAIISFEVKGGLQSAIKFADGLKLAQLAVSLGDCETLVQIPAAITHRGYPKERLAEFGLTESMVRISVGLEDSKDIIEDLEEGLKLI